MAEGKAEDTNIGSQGGSDRPDAAFASVKARFKTDAQGLQSLNREFSALNDQISKFTSNITVALEKAKQFSAAAGGIQSGGGMGPGQSGGSQNPTKGAIQPLKANIGGNGKLNKFDFITQIAGNAVGWTAARLKGAAPYMLTADRTGMLYRQMYGGSELDYQSRFRQPLTGGLLGSDAIEPMLALQATTGINAASMKKGIEGIRVSSGFGYSSGDATRMINALAQPGSSNTMTMMLGAGLYGPGGVAKDPMDVVRTTVQRMGLTNEEMVQGAFQPGSMTRANLSRAGLPEDMHNMILQYAQQNVEFKKKGGKGMYDPSSSGDRKRMGIDDAYAVEFERTRGEEVNREEKFYRRQVDNYAQMEKNTQALIRLSAAIEDKASGAIGAQAGLMNNSWMRALGMGLMGAGAAVSLTGFGTPLGVGLMGVGGVVQGIGDPEDVVQPGMNASFRHSLKAMATAAEADGHQLTLSSGVRDVGRQEEIFRDRMVEDPNGKTEWEGKRWTLKAGMAPVAPPGRSLHNFGYAADIGPSSAYDWIRKNASKFGLANGDRIGEPWHITLAGIQTVRDLPQGSRPVGAGRSSSSSADARSRSGGSAKTRSSGTSSSSSSPLFRTKGMNMSQAISAIQSSNAASVAIGDPLDFGGGGGSVTIAPTINISGSGNASDADEVARRVIHLLETSEAVRSLRRS